KEVSFLWITDRLVIVVALGAALIRIGNLMNSEIVGAPTNVVWAFIFDRLGDNTPRHPTQLYEGIFYLISFGILYFLYAKKDAWQAAVKVVGYVLILIFCFRFFIEYIKDIQVEFEKTMALNMGQWLSIPLVILGIWLIYRSKKTTSYNLV